MGGIQRGTITNRELAAAAVEARHTGTRTSIGCGGGIYVEVDHAGKAVIYGRLTGESKRYRVVRIGVYGKGKGRLNLRQARAQLAELRAAPPAPPRRARPVRRQVTRDIRSYPPFEPGTVAHSTAIGGAACLPELDPCLGYLGAHSVQFDIALDHRGRRSGRGVIRMHAGYMIMHLTAAVTGTCKLNRAATQSEARIYAQAAGLPRRAVRDIMQLCSELLADPLIRVSLDGAWRLAGHG